MSILNTLELTEIDWMVDRKEDCCNSSTGNRAVHRHKVLISIFTASFVRNFFICLIISMYIIMLLLTPIIV